MKKNKLSPEYKKLLDNIVKNDGYCAAYIHNWVRPGCCDCPFESYECTPKDRHLRLKEAQRILLEDELDL
jgi:hypothetical protein